ncbi:Membrane-associated phospholipid phosphatase [Aquiflexum balticum DSM 16537]|uniref:Membrane-associated phospholipid phosphatase n=1 Tax=Aquiflexum balticum DSM 16537 TaxID=758820 RepID=A0A1W2GYQ0_9BACT|nr:phosphatase PAP2 family protein [Aquiflexum balticum]SMD41827.1 Membrane-associated phospholipid phosphatase [Aquiflexum balticum DSM 16537]
MRNLFISYLVLIFLFLTTSACLEETPRYMNFDEYEFESMDETGGNWKTILVGDPAQINIPQPEPINSTDYQAELNDLKLQMEMLTPTQKQAVSYWSSNPILRWNEIALEMAAKYNLIPGPNADGTYTLPNPANPMGPPPFPFAHPPYTSRMLAYLSVAQFDALVVAWHYKFQYNRPNPSQVDERIKPAYLLSTLPSYPSDGATVAKVSKEILSVMFPLEISFLDKKYREHIASLVHAGINTQSDVEAGIEIGSEVVKLAMQRASADGMSKAQTPKSVSDSIANAAFEKFGWKWQNTEVPQRPVGLTPLFGQVKMWHVPTVEEVRSIPPPAPGSPQFETDVAELKKFAAHMTLNQRRIANWWEDGIGSYTPPGHWNKFAKEYTVKYKLNPLRTARVFAYMNTAIMDAGVACWDTKYYYHYPRPVEAIPGFKTILGTPNFPAYTSGHSTFSAAGAEVLAYFFPADAAQFRLWAEEAAMSRLYGGIHYRFDAEVGIDQGKKVAAYAVARAKTDGAQ